MDFADKTLRNEYMKKAQDIGSNAITLVKEFFDNPLGIVDVIDTYQLHEWTITDLDRALDEMSGKKKEFEKPKIKKVNKIVKWMQKAERSGKLDDSMYEITRRVEEYGCVSTYKSIRKFCYPAILRNKS